MRVLFTKDGAVIGNAIMIEEVDPTKLDTPTISTYLQATNQKMYLIETDFGNTIRLTTNEINEQFEYGPELEYGEWRAARQRLIDQ